MSRYICIVLTVFLSLTAGCSGLRQNEPAG